jgi:hypothetical protein
VLNGRNGNAEPFSPGHVNYEGRPGPVLGLPFSLDAKTLAGEILLFNPAERVTA